MRWHTPQSICQIRHLSCGRCDRTQATTVSWPPSTTDQSHHVPTALATGPTAVCIQPNQQSSYTTFLYCTCDRAKTTAVCSPRYTSNNTTSFVAVATETPADVSHLRSTTNKSHRALFSPCHRTSPRPVSVHSKNIHAMSPVVFATECHEQLSADWHPLPVRNTMFIVVIAHNVTVSHLLVTLQHR